MSTAPLLSGWGDAAGEGDQKHDGYQRMSLTMHR